MSHLRRVAEKYRAMICLYLLLGIGIALLQGFGARFFQTVIDDLAAGMLTAGTIAIYGAALLLLYIISYLEEYPLRKLEHGIQFSLKLFALKKMMRIDYLAYAKLGTGELIQRVENGAQAGRSILLGFYLRLLGELIPSMLVSIVFVFSINRAVMVAIALGYGAVFAITHLLLKALQRVKERILVGEERFNHFLVRGFMEMVVFRVNRRFAREIEKAQGAADEIVASKVRMSMIHEAFFTAFALLIGLVKIGIIVYGWRSGALSVGQIVALIALVDNAYTPIAIFNVLYVQCKLDRIAFARYTDFLDTPDEPRLLCGQLVDSLGAQVAFRDVGFRYEGNEALRGFSLGIAPGQKIAFVGESGSGKSTALKLLIGLLSPSEGKIEVGGLDLAQLQLDSYYGHVAYLPQEPAIFSGTLRENLVFDEIVDDAALIEALRGAGLYPLFCRLDKGLDTQLGEKGVNLSGGERQQLALARLWFSRASLFLLDEATSAIDNLTEVAVMDNVLARLRDHTVIAIAHRLDSIRHFDDIVVFQGGALVEQGDFHSLLQRQGNFYELYHRAQTDVQ